MGYLAIIIWTNDLLKGHKVKVMSQKASFVIWPNYFFFFLLWPCYDFRDISETLLRTGSVNSLFQDISPYTDTLFWIRSWPVFVLSLIYRMFSWNITHTYFLTSLWFDPVQESSQWLPALQATAEQLKRFIEM